jgi:hypothetical protein
MRESLTPLRRSTGMPFEAGWRGLVLGWTVYAGQLRRARHPTGSEPG